MINVYIAPYGQAVSDWEVESIVLGHIKDAREGYSTDVAYSNYLVLLCFRAYLIESPELQEHFEFYNDETIIDFDSNMRFTNIHQEPFCLLERLLGKLIMLKG